MLNLANLRTVAALSQETGISINTLRQWIYDSAWNGFDRCMIRPNRRIYIDLDAFVTWLDGCRGSEPRRGPSPHVDGSRRSARTV